MNDYKKVYEDAAKIHDEIERVKKYRKTALDCLDSIYYLNPDEKEFVRDAINAAYEPRIDNLLKKFFCTAREENEAAAEEPKDKTYYEFDFDTWSIVIDSDVLHKARHHCCKDDGCNGCVLDYIPCVYSRYLEKKYLRGEYRIIHKMEE